MTTCSFFSGFIKNSHTKFPRLLCFHRTTGSFPSKRGSVRSGSDTRYNRLYSNYRIKITRHLVLRFLHTRVTCTLVIDSGSLPGNSFEITRIPFVHSISFSSIRLQVLIFGMFALPSRLCEYAIADSTDKIYWKTISLQSKYTTITNVSFRYLPPSPEA